MKFLIQFKPKQSVNFIAIASYYIKGETVERLMNTLRFRRLLDML